MHDPSLVPDKSQLNPAVSQTSQELQLHCVTACNVYVIVCTFPDFPKQANDLNSLTPLCLSSPAPRWYGSCCAPVGESCLLIKIVSTLFGGQGLSHQPPAWRRVGHNIETISFGSGEYHTCARIRHRKFHRHSYR